jgi:hypothetical protein
MTNAIVNCDGFLFERVFEITKQKKKLWDSNPALLDLPTIFKPTHVGQLCLIKS